MTEDAAPGVYPLVSTIMTALDEGRHLAAAVDSVFAQDYPGPIELVVAVGPSRDHTSELAQQLAARYPGRMQVVDNPTGRTPAGLNLAFAATDPAATIIVRTDGHAQLPPGYVREAVATLQRTSAANVGGMMLPEGTTPFECAVARAMSTRIGLGSAPFHVGGSEGPADSVYLGVFRRSVLADAGGFDEHYARAQDWELNFRIRQRGGIVWFDPALRVHYRPRPNVRALAKQFHASGTWRWQIIRAHPATVSLRYLAAPAATLAIGAAGVVLVVDGLLVHSAVLALASAAVPAAYVAVVLAGSAATRRGLGAAASAWYPLALATMHLSWGAGFLRGLCADRLRALLSSRRAGGAVASSAEAEARPARLP